VYCNVVVAYDVVGTFYAFTTLPKLQSRANVTSLSVHIA